MTRILSARVSMLCFCCGLLVACAQRIPPLPDDSQTPALAVVVASEQELRRYDLSAGDINPRLTLVSSDPAAVSNGLIAVLSEKAEKRRVRAGHVAVCAPQLAKTVCWAYPSPDGRFVVLGFEDPLCEAPRTAELMNAEHVKVIEISAIGALDDVWWTPDSRHLVILDRDERYSLTPFGLLAALAGHPVPLNTYWLRIFDACTGTERRTLVAEDLPRTSAILSTNTAFGERSR